ncbi:MAG: hypothetical protein MJ247_01675 [Alphaproteobacteria bacterium]|nr:hypothetical protein [Alphaproteobacteria bacterium]
MADKLRFMFDRDFDDPDEVYEFVPELEENSSGKKEETPSGMISISDLLGSINSKLVLDTDKDLDTDEIKKLRTEGQITEDRVNIGKHSKSKTELEEEKKLDDELHEEKKPSIEEPAIQENNETSQEIYQEEPKSADENLVSTDAKEETTDNEVPQEEPKKEVLPEPVNELRKQGLLYTKEELEARLNEAIEATKEEAYNKGKADGYALGTNDAQQANETSIQNSLSHICEEIDKQGELISNSANNSFDTTTNLALSIIKKLFPTLEKDHGIDEIVNMLEKNFHFLREEPKITLKINPDILEGIKPRLSELVKSNGYSGKLALLKDGKLGLSDCIVEWNHGFLKRSVSDLVEETEKLVDTFKE